MHFIASRTKNYADKRELMNMVNELLGIQYNIAKANRTDRKVQNLAAYINADTLRAIHKTMDRKKAYGIDKVTKEDYEKNLEENLANLVKRMKNGSYRPNPTRRVYIPKETKGKMRPLGISSYEDKLVENAIAQILEQIYEPKFYNESFGFRPNRNCHQAVREIIEMVQYRKTNYVVEADIKGFFDNVDHEWLMKMLAHDIADRKFLEIIDKFLKAGVMENGKYLDSERGTPQGGLCRARHNPPCGVPRSLSRYLPFSMTPAFRNLSIISRNFRSAISCANIFISHSWSTLSKKPLMSASTT